MVICILKRWWWWWWWWWNFLSWVKNCCRLHWVMQVPRIYTDETSLHTESGTARLHHRLGQGLWWGKQIPAWGEHCWGRNPCQSWKTIRKKKEWVCEKWWKCSSCCSDANKHKIPTVVFFLDQCVNSCLRLLWQSELALIVRNIF